MDKRLQMNPPSNQSSTLPRFEITCPDDVKLADGQEQSIQNQPVPTSSVGVVEDGKYHDDDREYMDRVLENIDQMLMGEGMDEQQTRVLQESLDFQAKERSFYELLQCPDDNTHTIYKDVLTSVVEGQTNNKQQGDETDQVGWNFQKGVDDANNSSGYLIDVVGPNNLTSVVDRQTNDKQQGDEIDQVGWNSQKGVDDANNSSGYLIDVVGRQTNDKQQGDEIDQVGWNFEKGVDDANELLLIGSTKIKAMGKKNPPADLEDEEERSSRLRAVYEESNNVSMEEFDEALLCTDIDLEKKLKACTLQPKGLYRHCRNQNQKEVVDFRSLLLSCSKSIAAHDCRAADEFLKQIRKHSSPLGDGEQRLAHYFANGLEARLAGTGTQMQKSLLVSSKRTTASDYLRTYYTYISTSPFVKTYHFIANTTIYSMSEKKNLVHIIDFGIFYGFQWPIFIRHLSKREGGPPKLKITGIDFPQPGFRPMEIMVETGRRLAHYAEKFNVPFEFYAIAQNWDYIKIEDLKLEKGEFVAVNCMFRADNLSDEDASGVGKSPRNMVHDLVKKIKPDCFVHGVVSAVNGLPFFVSRFREALFHYSALYDMLETTIPREKPERAMLESEIFGKEALNVIACENQERLGRTETYKQWGVYHLRAGFVQLPFERELMSSAKKIVRKLYHRDFLIDEDKDWLLMGWKGRTLYAMSCWQTSA